MADADEYRRREEEITSQDRAIITNDFVDLIDGRTIERGGWKEGGIAAGRGGGRLEADSVGDRVRAGHRGEGVGSVLSSLAEPDEFVRRVTEIYQDRSAVTHNIFELADGRTVERDTAPQRLGGEIVGRVWSFRASPRSWPRKGAARFGPAPPRSARGSAPDRSRHRHAGDDYVRERRAPQADRLEPRRGHRQRLVRSLRRQSLRPRRLLPASRRRERSGLTSRARSGPAPASAATSAGAARSSTTSRVPSPGSSRSART